MFDKSTFSPKPDAVDAVITWVDGADPTHLAKRALYLANAASPLHVNGVNPHRWGSSDEVLFCLRSIEVNAPWVRRIWIIVDNQRPDLSSLSAALIEKIAFVEHAAIFQEFNHALPTFNSLSIESMMWRIDGLADRFLYFNDDVFLTAPIELRDMFRGGAPVLRGKWVDLASMAASSTSRADPALFNHFMQLNAALEAGFDLTRIFVAAHVVHPFNRLVMEDLFTNRPGAFAANVGHRFRDLRQFSPQALHNHACLAFGRAVVLKGRDYIHLRGDITATAAQDTLDEASGGKIRCLCVNDLPRLLSMIPDARDQIARAIEPAEVSFSGVYPASPEGAGAER